MITINTYKLQGNGTDSWHVDVYDCATEEDATLENRVSRDIVFVDPNTSASISMESVDLSTMSLDQLNQLKSLLGL